MVEVVDGKQVMSCKSTSVTDICVELGTSCHDGESHQPSTRDERDVTRLAHSGLSTAAGHDVQPVRKVC